jgi:N-acetyl-S-(2-succino)cysteine monooxygenase
MNVPRPPQGHPVIVQAGASNEGKDLAAKTGEVIFTAQQSFSDAKVFYSEVKGLAEKYNRSPDNLVVMPGVFPFIGRTQAEAVAKFEEFQALIDPIVGLSLLSGQLGEVDLSSYPLDAPLPDLPSTNAGRSRQKLLIDLAKRDKLTIRELYLKVAGSRGHWQLVGTPERISDELEEWFTQGAADGFNIMFPFLPGGLEDFVTLVIPELQRRNLFRTEYHGQTLREHLGLFRPKHPTKRSDVGAPNTTRDY